LKWENKQIHRKRDVIDKIDFEKCANEYRLIEEKKSKKNLIFRIGYLRLNKRDEKQKSPSLWQSRQLESTTKRKYLCFI